MWRPQSNTSVTDQFPHNSIRNKTYNNVIETLCCIAWRHKFVEQVDSGDIWQVDLEKNTTYPYFHVVPESVTADETTMTYNFQLIIMDLVEPSESNEQQVQSDTLQILVDIVSAFRNGPQFTNPDDENAEPIYYIPGGPLTMNPFTERFDNAVTGWTLDLGVVVDYVFPNCDSPFEIFDDEESDNCVQ